MTAKKGTPAGVLAFLRQAGAKGGKTRAKRLSKAERSSIARSAANARWSTKKKVDT